MTSGGKFFRQTAANTTFHRLPNIIGTETDKAIAKIQEIWKKSHKNFLYFLLSGLEKIIVLQIT